MKLKIVLEQIFEVSKELNHFMGLDLDQHLCYGKKIQNIEDFPKSPKPPISEEEAFFRHKNVDLAIAQDAKEYIINCVNEFCKEYRDGDMQTLFIGCILNLYYSSGLFDRNGCLCVEDIIEDITDAVTSQYIGVMEKLMMKEAFSFFQGLYKDLFTNEKVDELLKMYVEKKEDNLNEILSYINPDFEAAKDFVKEIIKEWDRFYLLEQKYGKTNSGLLQELCSINSEYQYANLLLCLDSIEDYIDSKGENDEFTVYIDKLDEDIFKIGIGMKQPSALNSKFIDGEIKITHPALFSTFGYGFPYIEYYNRDFIEETVEERKFSGENIKSNMCNYYPKYVGINIDDSAKFALGLARANKFAEKARYEKNRVIQQFSHTYMNMRATSLYNIATELLKNEDKVYRNYGRKLLYEYSVKKNLTKDVEMLKLRFEDNEQELYKRIADSILSNEQSNGVLIDKLVDDSVIRCMVTLVHDGGISAKKLRAQFENFDWIEIRNNFENEVLLTDNRNVREWFRHNMFDLDCTVSDEWRSVLFEEDSYAVLLLIDIISELITNIFKYADKSKTVTFEFLGEEDYMLLVAKNYIKENTEDNKGGGYGLEAETEALKVINGINGVKERTIKTSVEDGGFTVELRIAKRLFER